MAAAPAPVPADPLEQLNRNLTYYGYAMKSDSEAYVSTVSTSVQVLQAVWSRLLRLIDLRRLMIMVTVVLAFLLVMFIVAREVAYSMAIKDSRCYKRKQEFSRSGAVSAVVSKNGSNLMSVSYDLRAKMASTACMCESGNTMNAIPYWRYDFKTKRVTQDALNCMCDANYVIAPGELTVVGDDGLASFMYTGGTDDAKKVFGVVQATP